MRQNQHAEAISPLGVMPQVMDRVATTPQQIEAGRECRSRLWLKHERKHDSQPALTVGRPSRFLVDKTGAHIEEEKWKDLDSRDRTPTTEHAAWMCNARSYGMLPNAPSMEGYEATNAFKT